MAKHLKKQNKGFIALFTAIILGAMLMALVVTLNRTGFVTAGEMLEAEFKDRSAALARGCIDTVRLRLTLDHTYAGNETVPVGTESCTIDPLQHIGGQIIVSTHGTIQNAVTNLRAELDETDLTVLRIAEQ